jgi:hypothetical protein
MQQSQLPLCVEYIQALGPSFVAVIAALIAGYIAWRQWQTANHRLRLDMYERRYAIYEATKLLIEKVAMQGQITRQDVGEFYGSIRGAEFLFDGETKSYFMTIADLCWRAHLVRRRQERTKDDDALDRMIDEEMNILELVEKEGPNLEKKFSKYLDLSKVGL